jgi:serine/threonine-protein kinase RsbW
MAPDGQAVSLAVGRAEIAAGPGGVTVADWPPADAAVRRGPGWRVYDGRPREDQAARRWITQVIERFDGPADPADAAVVVSELFTNAMRHGPPGGRVLVGCCLCPGGARIVVGDGGSVASPRLRDSSPLDEGGRGLHVVSQLAAAWGHFRAGSARVVWCDLGAALGPPGTADRWDWVGPVLATTWRTTTGLPPTGLRRRPPVGRLG